MLFPRLLCEQGGVNLSKSLSLSMQIKKSCGRQAQVHETAGKSLQFHRVTGEALHQTASRSFRRGSHKDWYKVMSALNGKGKVSPTYLDILSVSSSKFSLMNEVDFGLQVDKAD